MATKRGLMIVLVTFVVAMLFYLMRQTPPSKDLPDFAIPLAPPAQPTHLAALRGKVVILDFWATWCQPCRMSMPHLEAIYQKYKAQGLVVIGISEDEDQPKEKVAQTAREIGVTYPIAMATEINDIGKILPHDGIPALYLLDKQGGLIKAEEGFSSEMMDTVDHGVADLLAR